MRESDTYMAMLENRADEAKRIILLQGETRFGPPTEEVQTRLQAITDIQRLEQLSKALLSAASWSDLLGAG